MKEKLWYTTKMGDWDSNVPKFALYVKLCFVKYHDGEVIAMLSHVLKYGIPKAHFQMPVLRTQYSIQRENW
jgi:hypothetical protein